LARRTAQILLAGAVLLAYANALGGPFQFDDFNVLVDNGAVHTLAAWARSLPGIRPLLKLSYALNWVLGPGPLGFHLVNVGLHLANALLVHALLLRCRLQPTAALAGALVFALPPVNVEAVTYVCGRSEALMACFYLGSLLAGLRGRTRLSCGLFLLAFLVKETAVTLPLALVLVQAAQDGTRPRVPWGHLGVLAACLLLLATLGGYQRFFAYAWGIRGLGANLRGQLLGVVHLLGLFLWPSRLCIDPQFPEPTRWATLLATLGLAALAAAGWWQRRTRPALALGLAWCFLHLLPGHSLVPRLDPANERQLYLPALGLVAGVLGGPWPRRCPRWALGLGTAVLALALGVRTFVRKFEEALTGGDVAAAKTAGAKSEKLSGGALVVQPSGKPTSAYFAFANADLLMEVFDPTPGKAYQMIGAGTIQPLPAA